MGGWPLEYARTMDRDERTVLVDEINKVGKRDDDDELADDEDFGAVEDDW